MNYIKQSERVNIYSEILSKNNGGSSFYEANFTLIPKPDKDITQKEENYK